MMTQQDNQPVTLQQSVTSTKAELLDVLTRHDPIWKKKFENFVSNVEVLTFRSGFLWGAIFCAIVCIVIFLVARP